MTPAHSELRRYRNRVLLFMAIAIGGFVLWATTTDLAKGVHLMGVVSLDTKRKVVQPQVGGVVITVLARDGQEVKLGDPIIALDQQKLAGLQESIVRNLVEVELALDRSRSDLVRKPFQPDLKRYQALYPRLDMAALMTMARTASNASKASMSAQLEGIDARLGRLSGELAGAATAIDLLKRQRAIVQVRVEALQPLVAENLFPRSDLDKQEQQLLELRQRLDEREVSARSTRAEISSLQAERQRLIQDDQKRLSEAMAGMEVQLQQLRSRLTDVSMDLQSCVVKAPASGQLLGFMTTTVGSVVQAGQVIGQIVPRDEPLVLEASVNPSDIERIAVGTVAEVRFTSLPRKTSPMLRGKITYVSHDTIATTSEMAKSASQQGMGYQIRVAVDVAELHKLGKFEVIPGLPAEIFTDGGSRSVMDYYFVSPIAQLFERALREY